MTTNSSTRINRTDAGGYTRTMHYYTDVNDKPIKKGSHIREVGTNRTGIVKDWPRPSVFTPWHILVSIKPDTEWYPGLGLSKNVSHCRVVEELEVINAK